jgi:Glu-tRNA(Gln) amidotransferase subunit E-like FAD-binding protein
MELQEELIKETEIKVEKPKKEPKKKKLEKEYKMSDVVSQYTLEGKYVRTFNSILSAEIATGIFRKVIESCINNKCSHAGGFLWGYDIDIIRKRHEINKR